MMHGKIIGIPPHAAQAAAGTPRIINVRAEQAPYVGLLIGGTAMLAGSAVARSVGGSPLKGALVAGAAVLWWFVAKTPMGTP